MKIVSSKTFKYQIPQGIVEESGKLSSGRYFFALARLGDYLYLSGGITIDRASGRKSVVNSFERMNVESGNWEVLPVIPTARYGHFTWVDPAANKIYISGGAVDPMNPSPIDEVEVFDVASMQWASNPQNFGLSLFGAQAVQHPSKPENVILVGGTEGGKSMVARKDILKFPASDHAGHSVFKTMRVGRVFPFPILTNQGKNLFVIGGTMEQKLDVYELENGMTECKEHEVKELEEYLFSELSNYTADISLSSCSYA